MDLPTQVTTTTEKRNFMDAVRSHTHHFTWSWFIWPLATLGLSLLIAALPYRFGGLTTIGIIVYIFGVITYTMLLLIILIHFSINQGSFKRSLQKSTETLFSATVLLGAASLICGAHQYGHPAEGSRLASTLRVVFWIYVAVSYCVGVALYMSVFTGQCHLLVGNMTPAWMLPIFPVILSGTVAGILASTLEPAHAFPILICGFTFQGLGTLISILVTAIYLVRLFEIGLPDPNVRPAMYLAVGPPAFTAVAFLKLSSAIPSSHSYFHTHAASVSILRTIGGFGAIFFWAYAFWFFTIATIAVGSTARNMQFHLTWYSFVFPNCGFAISTLGIGEMLECAEICWVGTAMACVLVMVWLTVMVFHARAVWKGTCLT